HKIASLPFFNINILGNEIIRVSSHCRKTYFPIISSTTLTPVKSTTERLTIPELLGGVKSYDELPPGWKNVEVIIDLAIVTPVQVYNLVSRQW
uniref:hypothetical protein n=1 Tax=uncultured Nostoc sp. TaxID=340711 RepID=UPI0035CC4D21